MNNIIKDVRDVLASSSSAKICVIGDVMLDTYSYGSVERISPEAPIPIMRIVREEQTLGGAANVFANLVALGAQVSLVGAIGSDSHGQALELLCYRATNAGSQVSLLTIADRKTTVKHRMLAQTQQVLRVDTEDTSFITSEQAEGVWMRLSVLLESVDVIVIADYGKGFLSPELVDKIMAYALGRNLPVVVDTKPKSFHLYRNATLFTPNEKETVALFPQLSFEMAGVELSKMTNAHILSTRGPKGMHFFPRSGSDAVPFLLPSYARDVRDVSGAGDTVTAAIAICLARGTSFEVAAEISNWAAAAVIAKPHTAVVTKEELEALVTLGVSKKHNRPTPTLHKIVSLAEAATFVRLYQSEGKVVGCMSGSFDVLSAKHFNSLEQCSRRCDVLIILLNSDSSVKQYKGKSKPILDETERSFVVAQSAFVERVVIFSEVTPVSALEKLKPDVFFNLSEWGGDCVEKTVVESYGGKIDICDFAIPNSWCRSTTDLIDRINRSESMESSKAVFLDRDGTLHVNKNGYIHLWEDIEFVPHTLESLKRLLARGYKLFVISNQSGVGRGYYTSQDVETLHEHFNTYFRENGITISGFYFCPHHPDDRCECRKPNIGMLLQAAREHNLNLSKSWFIGDSEADVGAARNANVRSICIAADEKTVSDFTYRPHFTAPTLVAATDIIVQ